VMRIKPPNPSITAKVPLDRPNRAWISPLDVYTPPARGAPPWMPPKMTTAIPDANITDGYTPKALPRPMRTAGTKSAPATPAATARLRTIKRRSPRGGCVRPGCGMTPHVLQRIIPSGRGRMSKSPQTGHRVTVRTMTMSLPRGGKALSRYKLYPALRPHEALTGLRRRRIQAPASLAMNRKRNAPWASWSDRPSSWTSDGSPGCEGSRA
jgi:hypothetical protein